jgi:CRISPR-associated protein Csb3
MAKASIPVDLFNPGQVFACMGFLEAADVLLGGAEGGFDWFKEAAARFSVRVDGTEDPVEVVLEFLAKAEIRSCAHRGYDPPPKRKDEKETMSAEKDDQDEEEASAMAPEFLDTFPASHGDPMTLPVRLVSLSRARCPGVLISHWADGSTRNDFKLYAGNRSAASIVRAMLQGTRRKISRKGVQPAQVNTRGVAHLWKERRSDMIEGPFDVLTPMGGSFNFDPRGAWTAIDAGYSPNDQKHTITASPVVEMLAAIGLEHSRPDEFETREVRYGVWQGLLPVVLARPALGGVRLGAPIRLFRFRLDLAGKNKIVTFAREETSP